MGARADSVGGASASASLVVWRPAASVISLWCHYSWRTGQVLSLNDAKGSDAAFIYAPPKTPLQVEPSSSARAGPSSSSSSSFVAAAPATSLTTPAAAAGSSPLLAAKAARRADPCGGWPRASTDEVWAEASRTVAQGGSSAHGV